VSTVSSAHPGRVICLEGPSAVGKTTLAAALARDAGAAVVPELVATGSPPIGNAAAWFVDRHVAQWQSARALTLAGSLAVIDGDPFKGLWYNWIFAADGWEGLDVIAPLYRHAVRRGGLSFPDLYVILGATEVQLRARRAGDATRSRRNFEPHLRLVEPHRRYFTALAAIAPGRVLFLDTSARDSLAASVIEGVAGLPASPLDSALLLEHMVAWVRAQPPTGEGSM
jgi:thymidylate kinase